MKDTFNVWSSVGENDIDTVMNYILTGRKAIEAKADEWLINLIGPVDENIRVLDFGCGVGRNTFGFATKCPSWFMVGYDNEGMLSKRDEFFHLQYDSPVPSNVNFTSDWESIKNQRFDVILCCIVLQHINEDALSVYLKDFKSMTRKLVVSGRRVNDDPKRRSTWTILDENGWTPSEFLYYGVPTKYMPEGEQEQHHTAIYFNSFTLT
jgi:2-polyprenyl-3-methyl-5-hydroxy-6-metoxy-1,4-benzoquinol methylase